MREANNLLVFHIGHLGDTLMIVPAIWALRKAFPSACFTLLTDLVEAEGYVQGAVLFAHTDFFSEILTFCKSADGRKGRHFRSLLEIRPLLRSRRFDAAVYLTPSARRRGQILRDRLFFYSLGIRRLIGFRGFERLSGELAKLHESQRILMRLAKDGIVVENVSFDLQLGRADEDEAGRFLEEKHLALPDAPWIAVAPFSKMQAKRWPPERYAELIGKLITAHGIFPVIVGGADEKEQGDALIDHWETGLNAAGLSVRATAVLLKRCRAYIGNDTGAMHLAAAVGIPCLAIFSARDEPFKWRPFGEGHIVLRKEIECAGCMLTRCSHRSCLMQITVDDAADKAEELLRRAL